MHKPVEERTIERLHVAVREAVVAGDRNRARALRSELRAAEPRVARHGNVTVAASAADLTGFPFVTGTAHKWATKWATVAGETTCFTVTGWPKPPTSF